MFNKKGRCFISLLLVFVIIISMTNTSYGQEINKEYLTADELNFEQINNEINNSSFKLSTKYMQEDNIVYDWQVNDSLSNIKMTVSGYENQSQVFSKDFIITFDEIYNFNSNIDLKNITNNDLISYIKSLYNANYQNNIQSIDTSRNVTASKSYVMQPILTSSQFLGALGVALLSFITANWAIIVVVLVIVAVVATAALLFDYLQERCTDVMYLTETPSLRKHIAIEDVRNIRRPEYKSAVYYSPKFNNMLVVYNIYNGYKGNVNSYMGHDSTYTQSYQMNNFDLTGFKLLVLYDLNTRKIFHAEVRYGPFATKAIKYFRYKNKMIKQIWPVREIDMEYDNPIPSWAYPSSTQTLK